MYNYLTMTELDWKRLEKKRYQIQSDIWVQIWEIVECVFVSIDRERSS